MKRQATVTSNPYAKKLKSLKKLTGRILVRKQDGALIIGKGGDYIKKIKQAYPKCVVNIPDTDHEFRVCQVDADDKTDLPNCMTEIINKLKSKAKEMCPEAGDGDAAVKILLNGEIVS